jgi:hypothetical protein
MDAKYKGIIPGFYQLGSAVLGLFFLANNSKLFLKNSDHGLLYIGLGILFYFVCIFNAFVFFNKRRWTQALLLSFLLSFLQIPAFIAPGTSQFVFVNGLCFTYFFSLPDILLTKLLISISPWRIGPGMGEPAKVYMLGINFFAIISCMISFLLLVRAQNKRLRKPTLAI